VAVAGAVGWRAGSLARWGRGGHSAPSHGSGPSVPDSTDPMTLSRCLRLVLPLLALAVAVPSLAADAAAQTFAIRNARVHTMAGPPLEGATVLVRDGRIAAVGSAVAVPAGVWVIDATGMELTPGFIDSATQIGVVEIEAYGNTNDRYVSNDRITAAFNVADGYNPLSTLIPVTRVEGITRAVVRPSPRGSLIAGQGILVDLGDGPAVSRIHRDPVAMFATLGETGAAIAGGARGAATLVLREALQDARDYAANRAAWERNARRDYALSRLDLEALVPVVQGRLPLVVQADRASDILTALRLREEFDLRMVIMGAAEGWMVAQDLARVGVPVIVYPLQNIPGFERLGSTLENAARLDRAGVTVLIGTGDLDAATSSHNTRNLKQAAGNAAAYGMPHDAALAAITSVPARVWGVADDYGTIEPGRAADLVLWSGDPLELTTLVEGVWIRGEEMPEETRQRLLFERYRDREPLPQAYDRGQR